MKAISLGIVLLTASITGMATATPKMWVEDKNGRIPLSVDTLHADITLTGNLVETIFTLRFRNKTNRMQEGEFVLPLPEGATISKYALEVKGALRDAVSVEKKQALKITWEQAKGNTLITETSEEATTHHLSFTVPEKFTPHARKKPKHVHIIWDASASCQDRDPAAEFSLLDKYFAEIQQTKVTLQLMRNTITDAGSFQVEQGEWDKLRKRLSNVFYDGSSGFDRIHDKQPNADVTFIITDGKHSELLRNRTDLCTHILHRSSGLHLIRATVHSHGSSINLTATPIGQAIRLLTHDRYHLTGVQHNHEHKPIPLQAITPGQQLAVTYRNRFETCQSVELIISDASGQIHTHPLKLSRKTKASGSILTRQWAQAKLRQIEVVNGQPSEIVSHCRKYGLVSDHTSLIVLERFRDYVTYDIPPPEPELREKWQRLRVKPNQKPTHNILPSEWQSYLAWSKRDHPWFPPQVLAQHHQANIWLRAVATAFKPGETDPEPTRKIMAWQQEAQALIKQQPDVKTQQSLEKWIKAHQELSRKWDNFAKLTPKRQDGQPYAYSIRGLVKNPKTYRTDKPLTLNNAIPHAGGFYELASPMNVSLYRCGHATTYNIASKQFRDFPLLAGDMVVVGPEPYNSAWGGDDPFGDSDGDTSPDPADQPAISPNKPCVAAGGGGGDDGPGDPFGPSSNAKKGGPDNTPVRYVRPPAKKLPELGEADWKQFAQACKSAGNAVAAYQKLLSHHPREDGFYLRAAGVLASSDNPDIVSQVLSNLSEKHGEKDLPVLRQQAFFLTKLKLHKQAAELIHRIIRKHGSTHADLLLLAHNQYAAGDKSAGIRTQSDFVKAAETHGTAHDQVIALSDISQFGNNPPAYRDSPPADLRCVFFTSNPQARIRVNVKEPIGHRTNHYHASNQGGRVFSGSTLHQYSINQGVPGSYEIGCYSREPTSILAVIYQHWGTAKQTMRYSLITIEPGQFFQTLSTSIPFKTQ